MSKQREGELTEETCDKCGVRLPVSGGLVGWTFRELPNKKFCASCAGHYMYPVAGEVA